MKPMILTSRKSRKAQPIVVYMRKGLKINYIMAIIGREMLERAINMGIAA